MQGKGLMTTYLHQPSDAELALRPEDLSPEEQLALSHMMPIMEGAEEGASAGEVMLRFPASPGPLSGGVMALLAGGGVAELARLRSMSGSEGGRSNDALMSSHTVSEASWAKLLMSSGSQGLDMAGDKGAGAAVSGASAVLDEGALQWAGLLGDVAVTAAAAERHVLRKLASLRGVGRPPRVPAGASSSASLRVPPASTPSLSRPL